MQITPKFHPLRACAVAAGFGIATVTAWAGVPLHSESADVTQARVDGHAFQNGGYGKDEVRSMQRQEHAYDLHLRFSEGRHNAYVAGLKLRVENASGQPVFAYDDAGPLTDIQLPAGHYRVVADYKGVRQGGVAEIKPGQDATLNLHWAQDLG